MPPAAEELLETLVRLEPGARVVRTVDAVAPGPGRHRVLVPDRTHPVALAVDHPGALAAATWTTDATTTTASSLRMLGTRAWLTMTGGGMAPDRVAVVGGRQTLVDHLSEVLGEAVTYTLRVDDALTCRRPVLQLFDERRRLFAHAVLGLGPASRRDLESTAAALGVVGEREWEHLEVPRVLARTTWEDVDVLVTAALRPSWWQGSERRRLEVPAEAMGELSRAWAEDAVRVDEMAWTLAQQRTAAGLRSRHARTRLEAALEKVLRDARRTTWPVGAWHGDWTAVHMARRGSTVQLWGWTRFEVGVPMGLDPCHFAVAESVRRHGLTPDAVRTGLREALRRQPGPGASMMGGLYLLAVTTRELALADGPGGHRVTERAEVLLTALEGWLGARP
ncbi:hypothetical protein [uncultured Nocardioides sp.]|uniref:hypothetical protein n=1 Tax=uncultured Nocardioides sp. TaxID=198441 RepID=UPI002628983E|nr:hypothetical protein [uncultured Nocardioides sp.]